MARSSAFQVVRFHVVRFQVIRFQVIQDEGQRPVHPSYSHPSAMSTTMPANPPAAGERAPGFTLPSTSGTDFTLADSLGREHVLLAFFPLAFTGVCTTEMCAFSEDYDSFAAAGVRVLPVSVDSVPTLKEFASKHDIKVEMLSDFHREVSRAYGVLIPERFFSQRAYFLIDREGVVRWSHVESVPSSRRENSEILAQIAALG